MSNTERIIFHVFKILRQSCAKRLLFENFRPKASVAQLSRNILITINGFARIREILGNNLIVTLNDLILRTLEKTILMFIDIFEVMKATH